MVYSFDSVRNGGLEVGLIQTLIIAAGLSMDAFAVAVCLGLSGSRSLKKIIVVGLYFGFFQAVMPFLGYLAGSGLIGFVDAIGHWIAFVVMGYLGGKMIYSGIKTSRGQGAEFPVIQDIPSFRTMLPLSLATSIDALAAGLGFAFIEINIFHAVGAIGITTFILSALGCWAGGAIGEKRRAWAEIAGGGALVMMGLWILVSHYFSW